MVRSSPLTVNTVCPKHQGKSSGKQGQQTEGTKGEAFQHIPPIHEHNNILLIPLEVLFVHMIRSPESTVQ